MNTKSILFVAVLVGMTGGTYAKTAGDQLGITQDGPAIIVPAAAAAAPVGLTKGASEAERKSVLKKMFAAGKALTPGEVANSRQHHGTLVGKNTEDISVYPEVNKEPAIGPLWESKVLGYRYTVFIGEALIKEYDGYREASSPAAATELEANSSGTGERTISVEFRLGHNGGAKFVVGRVKSVLWGDESGEAYFYLWK
ncbi:MAG: hypothetical protein WCK76_08565 [Elusimicrobiota bacterium]